MCADVHNPSDDPLRPEPGRFGEVPLEEQISEAVANGGEADLAALMRQAGTLGPAMVALLADALDGGTADEPADRRYFPYRLRFSKWDRGRPKSLGRVNWRRDREIIAFVKDCLNKDMPQKNAIKDASEKFGVSESIVRIALKR